MFAIIKVRSYRVDKPRDILYTLKSIIKNKYISRGNVFFNINMDINKKIIITLYGRVDIKKVYDKLCASCKTMHCSFYVNEEYNCNRCNTKTFIKRLSNEGKVVKKYLSENIKVHNEE